MHVVYKYSNSYAFTMFLVNFLSVLSVTSFANLTSWIVHEQISFWNFNFIKIKKERNVTSAFVQDFMIW